VTSRTRGLVVAIDGPAGAGKSTVSRRVADRLGYTLVDTGALYRAIALRAREESVSWQDGPALGALAAKLELAFVASDTGPRLHVDGRDRSGDIRTAEISQGASIVSQHPEVRAALLDLQRRLGADGGVVLEGRDIGTVVFPDAEVKVFLTATDEERARRRQAELATRGSAAALDAVLAEIRERDHRDSSRPVAPLRVADDAVPVDTTGLSLDAVVDRVVELVRRAVGVRPD
jgi:cytidylate kinase